jgi:hypothetical protein
MVSCSIFLSQEAAFIKLENFLRERSFINIQPDVGTFRITAKRRDSLLSKLYTVIFEIKARPHSASQIDVTVNPQHELTTEDDSKKEERIRSRLYFYF